MFPHAHNAELDAKVNAFNSTTRIDANPRNSLWTRKAALNAIKMVRAINAARTTPV